MVIVELTEEEMNDVLNGLMVWRKVLELEQDLGRETDEELRRVERLEKKIGSLWEKF